MPRDIPTPRPPTAVEGVLVRRAQLRRARADQLEREARRQAQRVLRDAEHQAETLRRQASQAGYQQGMLAALQQAAGHFAASQAMAWRWRERLEQEARAMLAAAVDHPDTLLLLLDEWLRDRDTPDATLYLQLPKRARLAAAADGLVDGKLARHDPDRLPRRRALHDALRGPGGGIRAGAIRGTGQPPAAAMPGADAAGLPCAVGTSCAS